MMSVTLIVDQGITIDYFADMLHGFDEVKRYDDPENYEYYRECGWSFEVEDTISVGVYDVLCTIFQIPMEENPEIPEELKSQDIHIENPRVYAVIYRDFDFFVKVMERVADRDGIWVNYGFDDYMPGLEFVAKLKSGWNWMPRILEIARGGIAVRVPRRP